MPILLRRGQCKPTLHPTPNIGAHLRKGGSKYGTSIHSGSVYPSFQVQEATWLGEECVRRKIKLQLLRTQEYKVWGQELSINQCLKETPAERAGSAHNWAFPQLTIRSFITLIPFRPKTIVPSLNPIPYASFILLMQTNFDNITFFVTLDDLKVLTNIAYK